MHTSPHEDVTESQVAYVLENWQLRGVKTDDWGRQSIVYLAVVPWRRKMVRVAVSMDDTSIVTAFPDRKATVNWNKREYGYFARRLASLEIRDVRQL